MQWIVRTSVLALALTGGALPFLPQLGLGSSLFTLKPTRVADQIDPQTLYPKNSVEYYLDAKDIPYVRPGLNVVIDQAQIPSDRHPVVDVSIFDDMMQPIDRLGIDTPGAVSCSFVIAVYDPAAREHHSYIVRTQTSPITGDTADQAATDSGGTFDDMGRGKFRYRYGTQLPANYDPTATHHLGTYCTRTIDLPEFNFNKRYVDNEVVDFRPDGGMVTDVWAAAATEVCNRCHYSLGLHGGSRKEVRLCVTCHNSGSTDPDTGNTVDFKVMIHKIHRGANLPSVQAGVPYRIIGFRQSVHDYSTVEFPQDIRHCTTCHDPSLPGGDVWYLHPSRKACGACHELNFETGEGHPGGPQANDDFCAACHRPEGDREFDASIMGAHTIPLESETLAGLNAEFLDIIDTGPGETPTVTMRLFNDDGSPVDPASLDRLRLRIYWPNDGDFEADFSEDVDVSRAMVSGDEIIYTLATPMPDTAYGSGTVSLEFRRPVTVNGQSLNEAGFNSTLEFAITDPTVVSRRVIVEQERCHACHYQLSLHGGNRFSVEYCVSCHRADRTDEEVRPDEELPPQGIHFKWLVHNIHTGEENQRDFTVYGFRSSVHLFNEVRFPGFRNVCVTCHAPGSYLLPLQDNLLPTLTPRDYFSPMQPITAACLGCHSSKSAAAHAYVMTADFGSIIAEACTTCHGQGHDFDVERVHAE